MKITSIDLYSSGFFISSFSFRDPALQDQYLVRGVTGLDAESIVPKLSGRSMFTKMPYYNMAMEPRTIVLRLVVNPYFNFADSYGSLRDHLYRAIARKRNGEIEVKFNGLEDTIASVKGKVVKFEASHSTGQPEIQLTISCRDPRLKSVDPVEVDVTTLSTSAPVIVDSLSTAPHGCQFRFQVTSPMLYFQVQGQSYDDDSDWFFKIQPGTISGEIGFLPGDLVTVVSEPGRYSVRMDRDDILYSIADKIALGSLWPAIFYGGNYWMVGAGGGTFTWLEFTYHNTYWGV